MGGPPNIGRYVVNGELGRGAMGVVYRALDPRLRREVAIKLVLPEGDRTRLLRRLSVEAVALGRLRHPGIVTLHEVGEHEGAPYMVMDLVRGRSLTERLEAEGRLDPREAASVARQVALALAHAHARGVVHRDVKPSNVLLADDGSAVLTDFGLAQDPVAASGLSQAGHVIGTPGYWPPEQARGKREQVGPRSDVYALGATLFAMLTGRPPFVGATFLEAVTAACGEAAAPPSSLAPAVGPALDAIVLRALEKAPADRFASADDMAAALERWLQVGEPDERSASAGRRPIPVAAALGATALALAAALIAGWLRGSAAPPAAEGTSPAGPAAPVAGTLPPTAPPLEVARDAFVRGLALQVKGRHAEARAAFDDALAAAPDLGPATVHRAVSRRALGDVPGALDDLARAIERRGAADPAPWAHRAHLRAGLGDHAGALADLAQARRLGPESVSCAILEALELMALGRSAEAIQALTALADRRPDAWRALYYRGWARRHAGDARGAVDDLSRVVAIAPAVPVAWRERAVCRLRLREAREALADTGRALALDPSDVEALESQAEARGSLGDAAGMERDASRVIQLAPARSGGWSHRATARLLRGDLRGALSDLNEALRLEPGWRWPLGQRARTRALLGDRAGALEDLAAYAAAEPEDEYHPLWAAGLGGGDPARLEAIAAGAGWLAAVARHALGRAGPDEVLAAAAEVKPDEEPWERRDRVCGALGYLGLFAERAGDLDAARELYRRCLQLRRFGWAQHQWALNRLAQLGR